MANECFSMSLIAYPFINEVIYWNTCGAVNNLSSLWKWKLWDVKQVGKFTTTVNIPIQPLSILVFFQLPILSFRTEYISATIRFCILRRRRKKKRTDVALLVSLHSYYCLSTLQSEKKPQFKQVQSKPLKNQYQLCIGLWEKNEFLSHISQNTWASLAVVLYLQSIIEKH